MHVDGKDSQRVKWLLPKKFSNYFYESALMINNIVVTI